MNAHINGLTLAPVAVLGCLAVARLGLARLVQLDDAHDVAPEEE